MKKKTYNKLLTPFNSQRTRAVVKEFNPTKLPDKPLYQNAAVFVYNYNPQEIIQKKLQHIEHCQAFIDSPHITWINVDGIIKEEVEKLCFFYKIHPLLQEDILTLGQRPKMDDIDGVLFCLLNMLYFNDATGGVEQEQISMALGQHFVITFQEDATRDVFNPIREKLQLDKSKLRQNGADYLFYTMIDLIVDNYFGVLEKLGESIETMEEEILSKPNRQTLSKVNQLRKEMIVLKRNLNPVRDMVSGILRSDSPLLSEKIEKYFKDIHDHIMQANDLVENYRDIVMSLQDLYLNNVNLKLNEVMKFLAIVTTLMAPATVIGGIFGMNFDAIPLMHQKTGFTIAVVAMLVIPVFMLGLFWKRGWFAKDKPPQ